MPWWGWLVIWTGLTLALLTVLALFAVLLFGKVRAIATELERLASLAMILDRAGAVLDDQRAEIAVLANIADVRRRREHVRFEASLRRQARRRDSIQRAKGLLRVDASQRDWFPAHDHTTRHDPR
jgi:hypothetical protein